MILGFKPRFVPPVADGSKPHSIRADMRWKQGMPIQFYENVRQPTMRKIRPDGVAEAVQDIYIRQGFLYPAAQPFIRVDGRLLTPLETAELAVRDGFSDFAQMRDWFDKAHGLPFTGKLIIWQPGLRY